MLWRVEPSIMVCTCDVAVVDLGQAGACVCGFPIVALMSERNQAVMDEKWPEWCDQTVAYAHFETAAP
jgi:hypothetical protein